MMRCYKIKNNQAKFDCGILAQCYQRGRLRLYLLFLQEALLTRQEYGMLRCFCPSPSAHMFCITP